MGTQTDAWSGATSHPAERENSFSSFSSVATLNPILELTDEAEQCADLVFKTLDKELSAKALLRMSQDTAKVSLSRDRVAILLEESKGVRLTCSQLKAMIELVSLDTHKKSVIYERYAQLSDKDAFLEQIVHNFTRSNSLRGVVMKDLSSHLESLAS